MAVRQFHGGPIRTGPIRTGSSFTDARSRTAATRSSRSGRGSINPYPARARRGSSSGNFSRTAGISGNSSERRRIDPSPRFTSSSHEDSLPLTFGVELEFILALKKRVTRRHIWMYRQTRGYALSPQPTSARTSTEADKDFEYRVNSAYLTHNKNFFHVAQNLLQRSGLKCNINVEDHTSWNMTEDATLAPDSERELEQHIPSRVKPGEGRNWETTGIELVSRVLKAPNNQRLSGDPSLRELNDYIQALTGKEGDPYTAYSNISCGLHVHIGLDPRRSDNSQLPLEVLQHLAFMLIQFESLISALHPVHRRARVGAEGGSVWTLGSGLMGVSGTRHTCNDRPLPLLQALERQIFADDMTPGKLAVLMSESWPNWPKKVSRADRYKFVNFRRLVPPRWSFEEQQAMTIEFRQHEGTMDFETVKRWVHFVVQLVRAAEKKSLQKKPASPDSPKSPATMQRRLKIHMNLPFPRQQGNKYKLRCKYVADELERLFDLLEFDRLTRKYWVDRFVEYNPGQGDLRKKEYGLDTLAPGRATTEECQACQIEREAEKLGMTELQREDDDFEGTPDIDALMKLLPGLRWSSDSDSESKQR